MSIVGQRRLELAAGQYLRYGSKYGSWCTALWVHKRSSGWEEHRCTSRFNISLSPACGAHESWASWFRGSRCDGSHWVLSMAPLSGIGDLLRPLNLRTRFYVCEGGPKPPLTGLRGINNSIFFLSPVEWWLVTVRRYARLAKLYAASSEDRTPLIGGSVPMDFYNDRRNAMTGIIRFAKDRYFT